MLLAESAGRWLEPWGNPGPRGMTVIGSNPRNRTRLTGRLHFFQLFPGKAGLRESVCLRGCQLPLPAGASRASISPSTCAGRRSFMHLKCPSGHARAKQGLQAMSILTMRALADKGGV